MMKFGTMKSGSHKGFNEVGYVALEFALAMGLLVLPTALILLQIPGYLEKTDRTKALASEVAQACASKASSVGQGDSIADAVAIEEMGASSTLENATLADASCSFESGSLEPGTRVTSSVSLQVSSPVIPGFPASADWTIQKSHTAIIPKYRSFDS